jgi:ferrous iron transport protein A
MSIVSLPLGLRLARRRVTAPAAPATASSLADLTAGQTAVVSAVEHGDDPALARRLFDLGFTPGVEVQMLRRAPLADPVVFRVAGYDIALRRAQARIITVAAPAAP